MRDVKEPEIRRAEIMAAAMLLFIEQGYTNTASLLICLLCQQYPELLY